MEKIMEGLVRRMEGRPSWQRWLLVVAVQCLFLGGFVLAVSKVGTVVRLLAVALTVATLPVMAYLGRTLTCEGGPMRGVDRRYLREFIPAMVAYVAIMIFVWPLLRQVEQAWLRALIAVSPSLPIALLIRAMVRYVLGSDEFMQRLHLEALAISAGVVGFVSIAVGFLVAAKVFVLDGSMLLLVYPALCMVYGVALAWSKRRYRA